MSVVLRMFRPVYSETVLPEPVGPVMRESEINQKGKARKLWDIEEGKGI